VHQGDTSACVRCAILIAVKRKRNSNGHRERKIKTKGCRLLPCGFQSVAVSRSNGILNNRGVYKLRSN
jgi:hypothetical protein